MSRSLQVVCVALFCSLGSLVVGCASKPPARTGFLSDYSNLRDDKEAMRYVSPKLKNYSSFIIDPVEMKAAGSLKPEQQAEVAQYFHDSVAKELTKRGYQIVNRPGVGVARVRLALTDIKQAKWYMNIHPASKLTGAGTGGASMEGEVIDSVSGEQLGAVIQAGKGNQFELDTFSKLDDVKDSIDKWAKNAGDRLDQLRKGA